METFSPKIENYRPDTYLIYLKRQDCLREHAHAIENHIRKLESIQDKNNLEEAENNHF